jgi:hypothetical protein
MSALLNATPKVTGAVSYTDGTLAPDHFQNGLPYEVDKTLAVDVDGTIAHYHQGLGFTAISRLAVTLTGPPARFGNGSAPMSASGHLVLALGTNSYYEHGVTFTPNASVNSTLTAPITANITVIKSIGGFNNPALLKLSGEFLQGMSLVMDILFTRRSGDTSVENFILILSADAEPDVVATDLAGLINLAQNYDSWAVGDEVYISCHRVNTHLKVVSPHVSPP